MSDDDRGDEVAGGRPHTFADKLTRLFNVLHPVGERPISTRKFAKRVKEHGVSISPTYISDLKTGKRTNPTIEVVVAIAAAFGIKVGYFTDPEVAELVDQELDRLEQYQQNALAVLAEQTVAVNMRTASLDDADRATLDEMVKAFWARRNQRRDT